MPNEDSNTPKRIHLLGTGRTEEGVAAGAITPGHLLHRNAAGGLVVHATAGGWAEKQFAVEDALQGKTIANDYASGDRVTTVIASPGDVVYGWLAAGEDVDQADFLTSNGDGTLKVAATTDIRVAAPLESIDNSDTGAVDVRIRVRIL